MTVRSPKIAAWLAALLLIGMTSAAHAGDSETSGTRTLSLSDLEQLGLEHNPTLAQAAARIDGSRGKALQAGLRLNPTIGYEGELLGRRGSPGGEFQGGFLQQEIVTAGKLRLSRAKYQQEVCQAELQAQAQQHRVINAIHIAFYSVLAAQRSLENHRRLLLNAEEAVKQTQEMVNVGQANEPDLLQAQIEAQRAKVGVGAAEKRYRREWTHLTALVGVPELQPGPLAGKLEPDGSPLNYEAELARLLQDSPEIQIAQAEVVRDQIGVRREKVEPIPNIVARGAVGYDSETRNTVANVSVGIKLPLFDRNQGSIQQARAELARAYAEVQRVELSLRSRLADAFNRYQTAQESAQDFRENSLAKAQKAYEIYLDNFRKRRAAAPQVLVAQRTYFQFVEEYTTALLDLRRAEVEIRGLLLVDGLLQPAGPTPQGHLEATPRPR